MLDKVIENNRVCIIGEVVSEFTFSHEVFGEGFYIANVSVNRLSDMVDIIPLMISERLIDVTKDYRGMKIEVSGQFRSYNKHEETRNRLILSVFVREISVLDDEEGEAENKPNQIYLDGYICKQPVYRKTPLGREIADLLLAVNRPYGKSDYIPCILWGRNAKFCENIETGAMVKLSGRIQSRKYEKKQADGTVEEKVAYELSVSKFSVIDEEENNKNEEKQENKNLTNNDVQNDNTNANPKTGDNIIVYVAMFAIALLGIIALILVNNAKRKNSRKH